MNKKIILAVVFLVVAANFAAAQKNELAAGIGGVFSPNGTCTASQPQCGVNQVLTFKLHPQISYEAEVAHRFFELPLISTYLEVPVVGIPARQVTIKSALSAPVPLSPPDYSSIYFTPVVKFKLGTPVTPFKPFLSVGGGLAHFRTSKLNNSGETSTNKAVFQLGGGIDIASPIPFLGIRGEIQEFFSGSPSFNGLLHSNLHSLYAGGALVLHF